MKQNLITLSLIIMAMSITTISFAEENQPEPLKSKLKAEIDAKVQAKIARTSIAKDDDSSKEHCADSTMAMEACYGFIKGFLKGALLTDAAIIKSLDDQEEGDLSFSERAKKTRLSRRDQSPTALAGFCLPEDQSISDLSKEILSHITESEINSTELANNVYMSLKVDYPC